MAWISHCEICRREKDSKIIMHKIRVSICFYGRVQGVGFRYKLRYLAEKYSVTGWARNEYDGSVSTELQGLEEDIDKILQALYNDRYIEIEDIRRRRIPADEEERGFRGPILKEGVHVDELYQAIEEKIKAAGYPREISGQAVYEDICDQIEGKENGSYVLLSKFEDDVIFEYHITIMDHEFNLGILTMRLPEGVYAANFDED